MIEIQEKIKLLIRQNTYRILKKIFKSFSHEFSTYLNCIISMNLIVFNQSKDEKIKKTILPSLNSAYLMASLVENLNDYNLIMGKKFELINEPFNVKELIEEIYSFF